jgi:hypothetical protein
MALVPRSLHARLESIVATRLESPERHAAILRPGRAAENSVEIQIRLTKSRGAPSLKQRPPCCGLATTSPREETQDSRDKSGPRARPEPLGDGDPVASSDVPRISWASVIRRPRPSLETSGPLRGRPEPNEETRQFAFYSGHLKHPLRQLGLDRQDVFCKTSLCLLRTARSPISSLQMNPELGHTLHETNFGRDGHL